MKDFITLVTNENMKNDFAKNVITAFKITDNGIIRENTIKDGAIMGIKCDDFSNNKIIFKIIEDIMFEYKKNKSTGIYIDFAISNCVLLVEKLDKICKKEEIELFVPMEYADVVENSVILVDTAISGGDFSDIFLYAKKKYKKIGAKISHIKKEFIIPSQENTGRDIEIEIKDQNVFFSEKLQANYYTKMNDDETCSFIIFDNVKSLQSKLDIMHKNGIKNVFINFYDIEKFINLS